MTPSIAILCPHSWWRADRTLLVTRKSNMGWLPLSTPPPTKNVARRWQMSWSWVSADKRIV